MAKTQQVCAYTKQDDCGHITLHDWHGQTILDCRVQIVREYRTQDGPTYALVFILPHSRRFIAGYALDLSGMLFRGELCPADYELHNAREEAEQLSEYWMEIDARDDEEFQAELAAEEAEQEESYRAELLEQWLEVNYRL